MRKAVFGAALAVVSVSTMADTLYLQNGEQIEGTLKALGPKQLTWDSPVLGILKLDYSKVRGVSSTAAAVSGLVDGCSLQFAQAQQVSCADGERATSLLELAPKAAPARPWQASIRLALEDKSGNTDEESVAVDVNGEYTEGKNRHRGAFEYDLERSEGEKTDDELKLSYQYDRFLSEKLFVYGTASYEQDEFSGIDNRYRAGFGLGYDWFNNEDRRLNTELGVTHTSEELIDVDNRYYESLSFNMSYRNRLTESGLQFFHTQQWLQSLDSAQDWEVETETGLKFPVIGSLSADMKFEYDYDHSPANGAGRVDRVWTMGVRYDL